MDADYVACKEIRRYVTSYIFILAEGSVPWNYRKKPSVALSTTEAEYMAGASTKQELVWLTKLLVQLGLEAHKTIWCCTKTTRALSFCQKAKERING